MIAARIEGYGKMNLSRHISRHRAKYAGFMGLLAFIGQLFWNEWERSLDDWFWDKYVRGVNAHCWYQPRRVETPVHQGGER